MIKLMQLNVFVMESRIVCVEMESLGMQEKSCALQNTGRERLIKVIRRQGFASN